MSRLHKYARLFWLAIFLTVASGQAAHAFADLEHAAEHLHSENCPEYSCCHFHTFANMLSAKTDAFFHADFVPEKFFNATVSPPESPVRKIDHPPQWS